MNSTLLTLFVITSATTILTPGPGVLMTVMRSIEHGFKGAVWTILGTASGTLVMAAISGTGVGLVLAHSPSAYAGLRLAGAAYLAWLGLKSWRARPGVLLSVGAGRPDGECWSAGQSPWGEDVDRRKAFAEGLALQMTNPVLIMFFVALFPQFIDPAGSYAAQYVGLSALYFAMLLVIHCGYSIVTTKCRRLLSSDRGLIVLYRFGGTLFWALAAMVVLDALSS